MIKVDNAFGRKIADAQTALDRSLAIIEFDPSGEILSANANFCRAMGYHRSETGIVAMVSQIDILITEIAQSSWEQATGLGEVNVAVNQMNR